MRFRADRAWARLGAVLGRFWAGLFARESALFATGLRVATIAAALWLSLEVDLRWASLPKGATVSLVGLVAPTSWWASPVMLWAGRALLWGGSAAWLFGHARKVRLVAGWATALGLLTLGSLYWENLPWFRHKFVPPLWLLVVLAVGQHARARPGEAPRWVREGAVLVLACFYAGAGAHKLLASGWRWADGTALQLWWRGRSPTCAWRLCWRRRRWCSSWRRCCWCRCRACAHGWRSAWWGCTWASIGCCTSISDR